MQATVKNLIEQADVTAGVHFRNPPVPYACPIPGGLAHGSKLYIQGLVPQLSARKPEQAGFSVNLQRGAEDKDKSDIFLHINPRFGPDTKVVVRNSRKGKSWGSEEREGDSPFNPGRPFLLVITATAEGYKMEINGASFATFSHREGLELADVTHLCIEGEVILRAVHIPVATMPQRLHVTIPGKAKVGDVFTFRGRVPEGAEKFEISLQAGPGTEDDVALHINPRFVDSALIRNSRKGGKWGTEDRAGLLLVPGQPFVLEVHVLEKAFKLRIDGNDYTLFSHRLKLKSVGNIVAVGDLVLYDVRIESVILAGIPHEFEDNWEPVQEVKEVAPELAQAMEVGPPKMEVLRPAKPVCQRLPFAMVPGTCVVVSGVVDKKPSKFYINLQTDVGDTGAIGLHFNPRFEGSVSVRLNSRDRDVWHKEVAVPGSPFFAPGKAFYVEITCEPDAYSISVNKRLLTSFPHRLDFNRIDYVAVDGSITVDRLAVF